MERSRKTKLMTPVAVVQAGIDCMTNADIESIRYEDRDKVKKLMDKGPQCEWERVITNCFSVDKYNQGTICIKIERHCWVHFLSIYVWVPYRYIRTVYLSEKIDGISCNNGSPTEFEYGTPKDVRGNVFWLTLDEMEALEERLQKHYE